MLVIHDHTQVGRPTMGKVQTGAGDEMYRHCVIDFFGITLYFSLEK